MGFKKSWDEVEVMQHLYRMQRECSSPYTDGYVAFDIKKDLYQIKMVLDELITKCPTFNGEEEWLTKIEKERILNYLKQ